MRSPLVLLVAFGATACTGVLEGPAAGPRDAVPTPECSAGVCREAPSPASRAPRLSHPQYEHAVRDLLGLPEDPGVTSAFLGDAASGLFDNAGGELRVGDSLWQDYQRAAESLAERATVDAASLARITRPEDGTDVRAVVARLGRRAHRRALTADEVDRYVALAAEGPVAYPAMEPFAAQVRIVVEAMLQSPFFLYRMELSTARDGDVIMPTDDELASRLSFALWDTMPDDALFAAADAGTLRTEAGLRAEARRLLDDPRARATVRNFHDQLLALRAALDVSRSTALFPEFDPALPAAMIEETRAFVDAVVFDDDAGLTALLTSPTTFVDRRLAAVYGLDGAFDDTLRRVDLDPAERAGLLTQPAFLATNSSATDADAIHRGVYVSRRLLCAPLPPPPMVVPPLPADETGTLTMRERIDRHTGPGTCGASCHGELINPVGFAFEHYDALGRFRADDRGRPVDARGQYAFGGEATEYDGAIEFSQRMADDLGTHLCYTRHWVEFAFGRAPTSLDGPLLSRLARASLDDDLSVRALLVELVLSEAFRTRALDAPETAAPGGP